MSLPSPKRIRPDESNETPSKRTRTDGLPETAWLCPYGNDCNIFVDFCIKCCPVFDDIKGLSDYEDEYSDDSESDSEPDTVVNTKEFVNVEEIEETDEANNADCDDSSDELD
jgi:hypothetical protein